VQSCGPSALVDGDVYPLWLGFVFFEMLVIERFKIRVTVEGAKYDEDRGRHSCVTAFVWLEICACSCFSCFGVFFRGVGFLFLAVFELCWYFLLCVGDGMGETRLDF
jgi:hypothetical protein